MGITIKNERIVQFYLKKIVTLVNPDKSIEGTNILLFDRYHYAIMYHVRFSNRLTNSEKCKIIQKSLLNLRQHNDENFLDNFKFELASQLDSLSKQPLFRYYLIIPTNIVSTSLKVKHFNVLNKQIRIRDYQWIKKRFDIENKKLLHDIELHSSLIHFNPQNAFFIIEDRGEDIFQFAEKTEEIFETLRSILNFIERYMRTPLIMWPRRPLSLIKEAPLLLLFDEKKEYKTLKFRVNVSKENAFKLDEINSSFNLIQEYRRISKKIIGLKDEKLKNKILLAFKLHNLALDNYDQDWLCCFYLWQTIEVLFTTKQTDKHEIIPGRVVAFLGKNEPFYDIIRFFMEKRHSAVHRAEFENFSKIDCDTMKEMVEYLMEMVLATMLNIRNFKGYESLLQSIDFYFIDQDINDPQLSSHLQKKKEISSLFEKSKLFQTKIGNL